MNKKCEECKYRKILDLQLYFYLGMDVEAQTCPTWVEEYESFKDSIEGYMIAKDRCLKEYLDENDEKCFYCKDRLRIEKSEKYFKEMYETVNKIGLSRGTKLRKVDSLALQYIDECGGF